MALRRPRWYFWAGAPASVLCLLVLPLLPWGEWSATRSLCIAACAVVFFGLAPLALFDSRRFWWATRTLTGMIGFGYTAYFVYAWFLVDDASRMVGSRNGVSLRGPALASLFAFALPALWYTVFGRLTLRKKQGDEKS